jgi:hypothetical protein
MRKKAKKRTPKTPTRSPPNNHEQRNGTCRPAQYPSTHNAQPSRRAFFIQEKTMTETIATTRNGDAANSNWEIMQANHDRLHAELQPHNKAALFDALAAVGVTLVVVSFDGSGDSGQIENIEVKAGEDIAAVPAGEVELARADWGKSEPQRATVSISEAVEQLVYDFLTETHSHWEDGDGAYGEFIFDVGARTITLDYNERYIESANHQHVF